MATLSLKEQRRAENLARSRKIQGQIHRPGGKQVAYRPNAQSRQLDQKAKDLRGKGRAQRREADQSKEASKKARDAVRLSKMKKGEARENLVSEKRWEKVQKEREKEMQEKGQTLGEWQKAKENLAKTEDKKAEESKKEAGDLSRQAASYSRQAERAEQTTAPDTQIAGKGVSAPPVGASLPPPTDTGGLPSNLIQRQALARKNRLMIIQQQTAQAQLSQAGFIAIQQEQEQQQQAAAAEQQAAQNQKTAKLKKEDQTARIWWLVQMVATVLQWFGILLGSIPGGNTLQTVVRGINSKFEGVGKSVPFMNELSPGYKPSRRKEDYVVVLGAIATAVIALPLLGFAGLLFFIIGYVMMNPVEAVTTVPSVVIGVIQGFAFSK